ncbi:hypothetical protein [Pseudonocardia nigra]|uniref:hypothetical protein n=1 Tax=Pseudonocardia nigra TaxID=1921578 RepID=UPI001C5F2366|nr:hypothetical protein [Pseudonocardia nigra]
MSQSRKVKAIREAWKDPEVREKVIREQQKPAESDKVRENRLRRMAARQRLRLEKSRRRDPRAIDYGTYMLVDPAANTIAVGDHQAGYGLSLDDVERALTEDR